MKALALLLCGLGAAAALLVGSGIYDNTGEVTEGAFMGYAMLSQRGTGLHFRTRTRTFIVVDERSLKRVAIVTSDIGMGMQMIKDEAVDRLKKIFPAGLYSDENILFAGTHTHAAPGGFSGNVLHDISTLGFNKANFDAAVEGIVQSIVRAHKSLRNGTVTYAAGSLDGASINRSPASYYRNPEEERAQYKYETDHDFTTLRFQGSDGTELGALSFFAVHAVSMNNTNTLVSGDNKGVASLLFEQKKNQGALPGQGTFVAAFPNANEGDVTPNILGPTCPDGTPCDFATSTCGGKNQGCTAKGPGKDQFESTEIIGRMQYETAFDLYHNAAKQVPVEPLVDYRFSYIDYQNITVAAKYTSTGKQERTCEPALGYAFAAGTVDGPGEFDFIQGSNNSNPFWDFVSGFIAKPTPEQKACHFPKPILLPVGMTKPLPWVPVVLPIQVVRLGQLWILAVPGESTSTSGRRLRNTVQATLQAAGLWRPDSRVLIIGLANSYTHYIATFQEYQMQRYEGASTIFGPHTLAAHQQSYDALVTAMAKGQPVPFGPRPVDMRDKTFTLQGPPPADEVPAGVQYGQVFSGPKSSYRPGEVVSATFWCASPRHNLMIENTFLAVERQDGAQWRTVLTDGNLETRFHWRRPEGSKTQSLCTVEWYSAPTTAPAQYRIRYFGVRKDENEKYYPIEGTSQAFRMA